EAIAWLKGYLAEADVLVQNLRPGVIDELGLGAEALQKINPRLIFCSLWAFGHTGPRRLRPGYEPMVQAFAGLFSVNGGDEDPPSRFGAPVLDLGTGMWAAMGVLAALHQRASTGRGAVVDASLFETALGWLTGHIAGFKFTGSLPLRERTGSRRLVPFQGFQTKNGTVIIAAGNDRLFAKLVAALGHPEWSADPRFISNAERRANRDELIVEMEKVLTTREKEEWIDILEDAGVPCAPIQDLREMLDEPQTAALGLLQAVPDLDLDLMTLPLSFDGRRAPVPRQHREHRFVDPETAPRRKPQVAKGRIVEAHGEPAEVVVAHAHVAIVAFELTRGQVAVREPLVDDLRDLDPGLHGEENPRGKDRIEERGGIAHDRPAVSRQPRSEV